MGLENSCFAQSIENQALLGSSDSIEEVHIAYYTETEIKSDDCCNYF